MNDLKAQQKKVIIDHLVTLGYPNITADQVMGAVKDLYEKLKNANLHEGLHYLDFLKIVTHEYKIKQFQAWHMNNMQNPYGFRF